VRLVVLAAVTVKSIIIWDLTSCNLVQAYGRSFKTLLKVYQTTRRHIPEDTTLQDHFATLFNTN
jgi:hypothetical protein